VTAKPECGKYNCACECVNCRLVESLAVHCWKHKTKCHRGCALTGAQYFRERQDEEWINKPLSTLPRAEIGRFAGGS
jgi:hypothetical protein